MPDHSAAFDRAGDNKAAADEPINAEIVAEAATSAAPMPAFPREIAAEVLQIGQTHRLGAAIDAQRVVYALVARTLFEYRADRIMLFVSYLLIPATVVAGAVLGFLVAAALGWSLALAGLGDVLVWLVAGLVLLVGRTFRDSAEEAVIGVSRTDGKIDSFKLGRFEEIFRVTGPAALGLFFGVLFGVQQAVLMFAPGHLGLPLEGTLSECFLLTLDNVCHGIFLDTFELYNLHWGERLEHSYYSASVFYAFRIAFDALAFLIGYALWKRYHLARFFHDFPRDERDVAGVLSWIVARFKDRERWPRRYHDELMFLLLAKEFISGDFTFAQRMSSNLPQLQIHREVRELFRAADGTIVLQGLKS